MFIVLNAYNVIGDYMKYYLIGIKGSGMAALAGLLQDDGHEIIGLDFENPVFTEKELQKRNIVVETFQKHDFSNVDLFIIGHSFINHAIIEEINDTGVGYKEYHKFISVYFDGLRQVAIAGSHGKTTTVGLFYAILSYLFPLKMLRGDGVGVGGQKEMVVYEACEYKEHFLKYNPNEIIITNIDYDHCDYFLDVSSYIEAFQKFANKAYKIYICYEDSKKINAKNMITFDLFEEKSDYHYSSLNLENGIEGMVCYKDKSLAHINLPIFGQHNAMHVLVVIAYLNEHNYPLNHINEALANFGGINRRLQIKSNSDDVFIDDYAHHPQEIEMTIKSVRLMYPSRRVIAIFKPDRLSRLKTFKEEFKVALKTADEAYILPIYEKNDEDDMWSNLLQDEKITLLNDDLNLEKVKKHDDMSIYLFMSSKNIDVWINSFEKNLHKHS